MEVYNNDNGEKRAPYGANKAIEAIEISKKGNNGMVRL